MTNMAWKFGQHASSSTRYDSQEMMKHLIHTKEQRNHVQKSSQPTIHCMGGRLAKVTTKDKSGNTTQHYSKEGIETTCLEEAWARFTQANHTPFYNGSLILDLQVLGSHLPTFDQIATLGTPSNSWQLIPLLAQLAQITDWPTKSQLTNTSRVGQRQRRHVIQSIKCTLWQLQSQSNRYTQ